MRDASQEREKRGLFITVEGIEGVGKSTNMAIIAEWIRAQGVSLTQTREPGGTPFAEEMRELLLRRREEEVSEQAELLLIFAARAQHLAKKIWPALERGDWVLSDRFTDATYAYQGGGRGLSQEFIAQLESLVQGDFRPDLTIILDAPPAVGMQRVAQRGAEDRFETEQQEFFERVRAIYLSRMSAEPERFVVVDASKTLEEVRAQLIVVLEGKLLRHL